MNVPADLKYTKSHEWVRLEGDVATIGITDHAQSELGDVVYVDLPTPGRALATDETFGTVESVKTVSDLYAPVAGEVVEVNGSLNAQSELVNTDPYGGGPGMVMMAPVVADALASLSPAPGAAVVMTDPAGELFTQYHAEELAAHEDVVFLCGHYEGVDERVRLKLATHCFTIGDYVLTGGELPALVMADSIVRLREGVLGDPESHRDDSHSNGGLLGFPLYTRPAAWEGQDVPPVLTSGDHGAISRWRRQQQLQRTRLHRPDLFARADLRPGDLDLL